jgi:prophage regulatory protein
MEKQSILPETGFVRLATVLALIPVGKSSWWEGIKKGRFPKPIKLGPRTTAWRVEDIRHLIEHPVPSN